MQAKRITDYTIQVYYVQKSFQTDTSKIYRRTCSLTFMGRKRTSRRIFEYHYIREVELTFKMRINFYHYMEKFAYIKNWIVQSKGKSKERKFSPQVIFTRSLVYIINIMIHSSPNSLKNVQLLSNVGGTCSTKK